MTAYQGSKSKVMNSVVPMQVADSPGASRTSEFAELTRQLDLADEDIALVNRRLDESQGKLILRSHLLRELELTSYNIYA